MFKRRSFAVLIMLALLAAACAPAVTSGGPSATSSAPKLLTVGVGIDAVNFEMTDRYEPWSDSIAFNGSEPLFRRGPDYKIQNVLAASYTANADASVWDVTLRPNVKFHNGDAFNADAVKFTFDKIMDPNRKPVSVLLSPISSIKQVDVVSPMAVRFTLKFPNLFLRESLGWASIVDPKFYADHDLAYLTTHLNGTGPFKLIEWVKGDHAAFEANPDYWGGKPKLDKLTYKVIPEAGARLAALKTGEVDVIDRVSIDDIDQLSSAPEIKVGSVQDERTLQVGINQLRGAPELKDLRLRQAMNYAVDVNAIVKNLLKGLADRVPGTIARKTIGFNDLTPYPYDPVKAKQLVADVKLPANFALRFSAPSGNYPKDKEVAQAIADYLRAAGIAVNLDISAATEFTAQKNAVKLGDLWLVGWSTGAWDGLPDMTFQAQSKATLWSDQYVYDTESDRLLALAAQQTDPEKRAGYLRDVQKLLYDKAYSIFLYTTNSVYAYRTRVQGFEVPVDQFLTISKDVTVQ